MSTVRGGGDRRATSPPSGGVEREKSPRGNPLEIMGGGGGSNSFVALASRLIVSPVHRAPPRLIDVTEQASHNEGDGT